MVDNILICTIVNDLNADHPVLDSNIVTLRTNISYPNSDESRIYPIQHLKKICPELCCHKTKKMEYCFEIDSE